MPINTLTEADLLKVFDKSFIGMVITSIDGRWIKVNPHFCEILGYTIEELTGKNFSQFTYVEDLENSNNQVKLLLSGEIEHFEIEKRYIHKNGQLIHVLLNSTLVRDAKGEPTYFI